MISERDYYNMLETAKEDGFEAGEAKGRTEGELRGLARGREEGLAEGKAEVARAMLASGMPVEQISSLTGLSAEEIRRL